jgi:hypothetical protein
MNINQLALETIIDKVLHPRKYDNFADVPGQFACAEFLLEEYWYILSPKYKRAVSAVLVRSGKYVA